MILTLDENKKKMFLNNLICLEERKKELEYLEYLYETPNMELGYLEHGGIWFSQKKPDGIIMPLGDIHVWSEETLNSLYPIKTYTSKAKNTLYLIRQILGKDADSNFKLANFFACSANEIIESGILTHSLNLDFTLQKLKYILQSKDLALPMLRDYYLDFYLFVSLLNLIEIKKEEVTTPDMFSLFSKEALENTEIMNLAFAFNRIRKK